MGVDYYVCDQCDNPVCELVMWYTSICCDDCRCCCEFCHEECMRPTDEEIKLYTKDFDDDYIEKDQYYIDKYISQKYCKYCNMCKKMDEVIERKIEIVKGCNQCEELDLMGLLNRLLKENELLMDGDGLKSNEIKYIKRIIKRLNLK